MSYYKEEIKAIITIILTIIFVWLIGPIIWFWCSWLAGFAAKITIGNFLVSALQLINIEITKDQIPWLAAALGWISSFFYTYKNNKKDKN